MTQNCPCSKNGTELKPFLCCFWTFFKDLPHQAEKEKSLWLGTTLDKFKGPRMLPELPCKHARCKNVLSLLILLVRETVLRWGRPLFSKRSAVQQWFRWPTK
jgi:hypothetical protein